jgi:phosphoesterase RecJ-like protein
MIYDLARRAGVSIDLDLALPLYVALLTDTGRFSYGNTTPSAHRMAEALLAAGVDPADVHRRVYREKTVERIRLEARAMSDLRTALDGHIAWCAVDAATLASAGVEAGEARDLIGIPSSLAGVEVALSFRELPGGAGTKISLRSFHGFRVDEFAARHGGGGHRVAAGVRLDLGLVEAQDLIIGELAESVRRSASRVRDHEATR